MSPDLPSVSVVVDNYNYGRFLRQCLGSVLAQDYPSELLEVILVDDGSTDDSLSVAASFGGKVKVLRQANAGQSEAFNAGIRASRGEVVMFLDADDYWDPDKVRVIAREFSDPEVAVVQHPLRDVGNDGREIPSNLLAWPRRYSIDDFLAGGAALAAASGLAVRRKVLEKMGPIPADVLFAADAYMIVSGLLQGPAANVSRYEGWHRLHGSNNWAGHYSDPRKLRRTLEVEASFHRHVERLLSERGLALGERYRLLYGMDLARREVLLAVQEGRRGDGWRVWRGLLSGSGMGRLRLFRAATLLLAFASPALYLRLYSFYRVNHGLVRLRGRVLPVS